MLNRRDFLRLAGLSATVSVWPRSALAQQPTNVATPVHDAVTNGRPPFRILFSNDTTNILSCVSPFHEKGQGFEARMLEATVDETAGTGIDVHILQPGLGWVPWWQSEVYPIDDHVRWWKQNYGFEPTESFLQFIRDGGDMVDVFVRRCRQKHLTPFISLRLNDTHHLDWLEREDNWRGNIARFYAEHPEYRLGDNLRSGTERVQNWAIDAVREYKFRFVDEICRNYDIDGFELDFLRFWSYFRLNETTSDQRRAIMRRFVERVRRTLDRTARPGQRRWLCVRIPVYLEAHDCLGVDVRDFASAGVDMFNCSASYFTIQQHDLARIRALAPDRAVYLEVTHTTSLGNAVQPGGGDVRTFRRTTDEQFYTTAHLAYEQGADGISAFNFVYYREHGAEGRGPFNEPPFHVFQYLRDPAWLARQAQHYVLGDAYSQPKLEHRPMPRVVEPGAAQRFELTMAAPTDGWQKGGRFRIQSDEPFGDGVWSVTWNGVTLEPTANVSEPYPNPYPPLLGAEATLRAWVLPADVLRNGLNRIEVTNETGPRRKVIFLDAAVA